MFLLLYFRFTVSLTKSQHAEGLANPVFTSAASGIGSHVVSDNLVHFLRHWLGVAPDLHHAPSLLTALPIIRIPPYSAALPGFTREVSTPCNPSCASFRNSMTAPLGCRGSLWRFRLRFPESFQTWARTLLTRSAAEMPLGGCLLRSANERDLCTGAMIHCLIPSPFTVSL